MAGAGFLRRVGRISGSAWKISPRLANASRLWKGDPTVGQVFEGTPKAVLQVNGKIVTRGDITEDWGSRLQWKVIRDGKPLATMTALRLDHTYEHADQTPGKYQVVLQMFKYVDYKKDKAGGE